ncbi:peptidase [Pseudomonas gingeri NCPPB 3146 = LMG 5327]|uniref:PepSY domain-containing protein n=2 Tax=Pseudomonas gingeri TaxID=117681 RepID=A0A7Y7Y5F5_9PSED|nr:PepSY domain-containing protein [Pseudomonas gingeri]NVZ29863.1 PepSY domain-containing protein [Pseudomonas gingeri]NVZ66872.1 PepSY domain-containing protein [Pseudomonas gingeri]NVZ74353.1 PepSY domain-containing protein [Pseudomonas gingeri]NWA10271.1 PepSY domain-containing protein [Pseudomonas gingeri]NWC18211.1 PepSY domain-containing protein [Pseudomonas gingeri]
MKALGAALAFFAVAVTTCNVSGRDIASDEAAKLQAAGTIQPLDRLTAVALARHPGAVLGDTELDEKYGHYIYQVELRDAQGIEWEIELDAISGQVLKDHQDR